MARNRKFQTNFSGGVLAPSVYGRTDIPQYSNGMAVGRNIVVEAPGGVKRRPGSVFIREYPDIGYVRLFPFRFNTEQEYLIVVYEDPLSPGSCFIDIYRDNVLLTQIAGPYGEDDIKELDYAQSADSMIISHGNHEPRVLRRLGTDVDWELVVVPFVTPPPEWEAGEWPKYCTFHQGRLWFACSSTQPQSAWGSVAQDFFNFNPGTGDADSIHDILDTDQINPITAIYSERHLQVFTTGSEFINTASVITPTTSAWKRQSNYGSYGSVQPVSINGGVLFLDRTGRTIRNFLFTDAEDGYTSESISLLAEHLVIYPQAMGVLRGRTLEASSFVFVVNQSGTMAVLNLMKSIDMIAWTEWVTQGNYKDVFTIGEDTFILVERKGTWILEQLSDAMYTDSGSLVQSLDEVDVSEVRTDEDNFFGINFNREGKGQVVVVWNGEVVYKRDDFKTDPERRVRVIDHVYVPLRQFSSDDSVRQQYFPDAPFTNFYMYSLVETTVLDGGADYIGGLPHLIGRRVSMVLDGSVFPDEIVVPGDELPGGGHIKTYPNGSDWKYTLAGGVESYMYQYYEDHRLEETNGFYEGTSYPNIEEDFYGFKIGDFTYLERGKLEQRNDLDTPEGEMIWDTPGSYKWTCPPGVKQVTLCAIGGGGSGSNSGAGGYRGSIYNGSAVGTTPRREYTMTVGAGGASVPASLPLRVGNRGANSIALDVVTMTGGAGGNITSKQFAGGGQQDSPNCMGTFFHGDRTYESSDWWYGGQAGFANGGRTAINNPGSPDGSRGSGGGSCSNSPVHGPSGKGGDGYIKIAWNATIYGNEDYFATRLMVLEEVDLPATDGVVPVPRPYIVGQAGLWYGVEIETMPIAIGTSVNEPKRIVNVTANYKQSAGMTIENIPINTKYMEPEMLDSPAHLETGTKKLRLLGYNTKTTVQVKQDAPLPMTLLSLDMEIKY